MRRIRISLAAIGITCLLRAQTSIEDSNELMKQAMQSQQSGDYASAARAYRAFLKLHPDEVAAHVNLGVVLVNSGRFDEAIAEYGEAEKLLPGDPRIDLNTALAYEKSGRLTEAAGRFEALHSTAPQDNQVTMLLADCNLQLGNDDRVIDLLQPMGEKHSGDLGVDYMLGMALLRKGRVDEAQVYLDHILKNGDTAEARFLLGTRIYESGDYPQAVRQLGSAVELNPSVPGLQALYGKALLNTGDADGASAAFQKELSLNPNDFGSNLGYGQVLTARKQFARAIPVLERAVLVRPQSEVAKLSLAQALIGSDQYAEARPYAESAARDMPQSFEAHKALAAVYSGLHLTDDADRENRAALSLMALRTGSEAGPKLHQAAPLFELPEPASGKKVRLADLEGRRPVVLVFGSYSCPNFRSAAGALTRMQQRYGSRVGFLLVYIREAHADGAWQSTRNTRDSVSITAEKTFAEKEEHATICSRKLHLRFPAVVDGMDAAVEKAYNAWPSRAFVVGKNGQILYSTPLTELDFHPADMESVLRQVSTLGG